MELLEALFGPWSFKTDDQIFICDPGISPLEGVEESPVSHDLTRLAVLGEAGSQDPLVLARRIRQ